MTYIEFFDRTSIENICSILTDVPNRVVLVGDNKRKIEKSIKYYKKVFSKRGYEIEFLSKAVSRWDMEQVIEVLTEILNSYDDCVFGITGGDEIAMLALGIVYERNRDKNIQIHKVGISNNRIYDCDKDGNTIYKDVPQLSVEENIRIYGGDIAYGDIEDEKNYMWDLTPEFCEDVDFIWSICRDDVRAWNKQIGVFETIGGVGLASENGLVVEALVEDLKKYYKTHKGSYGINRGIVNKLVDKGIITEFQEDGTQVLISYKNAQVKKCLTKAGQALEMKIFLTAKRAVDPDGVKVYNDVMNGVVIDWDGEFHEEDGKFHDTKNEIDVLIMHDMIPIFVSCKNGIVTADELYKLNTVAERFGGVYSKKVLVATSLSGLGEAGEYLKQRAQDMNIKVLENVQEMDDCRLERRISKLWEA